MKITQTTLVFGVKIRTNKKDIFLNEKDKCFTYISGSN